MIYFFKETSPLWDDISYSYTRLQLCDMSVEPSYLLYDGENGALSVNKNDIDYLISYGEHCIYETKWEVISQDQIPEEFLWKMIN